MKYVGTNPTGGDYMGILMFGISSKYPDDVGAEGPRTTLRDRLLHSVPSCFEEVPLSSSFLFLFSY